MHGKAACCIVTRFFSQVHIWGLGTRLVEMLYFNQTERDYKYSISIGKLKFLPEVLYTKNSAQTLLPECMGSEHETRLWLAPNYAHAHDVTYCQWQLSWSKQWRPTKSTVTSPPRWASAQLSLKNISSPQYNQNLCEPFLWTVANESQCEQWWPTVVRWNHS